MATAAGGSGGRRSLLQSLENTMTASCSHGLTREGRSKAVMASKSSNDETRMDTYRKDRLQIAGNGRTVAGGTRNLPEVGDLSKQPSLLLSAELLLCVVACSGEEWCLEDFWKVEQGRISPESTGGDEKQKLPRLGFDESCREEGTQAGVLTRSKINFRGMADLVPVNSI